jgi:hypothetical protein
MNNGISEANGTEGREFKTKVAANHIEQVGKPNP